jgi:sugar phosphate isomerase/epimerase
MSMKRRDFIAAAGAIGAAGLAGNTILAETQTKRPVPARTPSRPTSSRRRLGVGICDWSLKAKGRDAFKLAREIGLDSLQVSPNEAAEVLSYSNPEELAALRAASREFRIRIASVGLNIANKYPIATDKRAASWLIQTIDAAKALGSRTTLIAFFGNGALKDNNANKLKTKEIDAVIGKLKEAAPHAEKQGIYLGLENTLSAKENMDILEKVGSDHVKVYYDIANSTKNGYDVPAEIKILGERICEFHFKNTDGVLGQSGIKMEPIIEAVNEINYQGWIVLERHFGDDMIEYYKKNAQYIRKAFNLPSRA